VRGFERCCPLALLKARSLPKRKPGLEICYLFEMNIFSILDFGAESLHFAPCKPLFPGNFCIFA
jgi:hypothetical protein